MGASVRQMVWPRHEMVSISDGRGSPPERQREACIPAGRRTKPSALPQNASAYSDGSIFHDLSKSGDIGPIVGDNVPGHRDCRVGVFPMKAAMKWGAPQPGAKDFKAGWFENSEIVPRRSCALRPRRHRRWQRCSDGSHSCGIAEEAAEALSDPSCNAAGTRFRHSLNAS